MRRILMMIPLLLGITLISFIVIQLAPGAPVGLGAEFRADVDPAALDKLREYYGLNKPLYVQYWDWLIRLAQFDFGQSFAPDGRPVLDKILEALPVTLWMNIIGLFIVLLLAIPIGVYSAKHQNKLYDRAMTLIVFVGFAAPGFWLGLLALSGLVALMYGIPGFSWPLSGIISEAASQAGFIDQLLSYAKHLALPILVGIISALAGLSRYMRSSMLEIIRQDYMLTARAKGCSPNRALWCHGMPNALLPVITILGLSVPGLIGGSVIIESLFSIPGMGKLFYDGVMMRDYPLIMAILTFGALLTLIGNLLADLGYALADPRLRKQSHA
jgi:peptide/nickel transport system permease protein